MTTREQRARARERQMRAKIDMARVQLALICALVTDPRAPALLRRMQDSIRDQIERADSAQSLHDHAIRR